MRQFTRKGKDTSSIRQFTRKDVEDCFNKSWGAAFRASGDTVTINGIAWLWGVTPPTWRVDYRIESVTGFRYHDVVLLVQHY